MTLIKPTLSGESGGFFFTIDTDREWKTLCALLSDEGHVVPVLDSVIPGTYVIVRNGGGVSVTTVPRKVPAGFVWRKVPEPKGDAGYKVVVPHENWFEALDALYRAGYWWKHGGTPSVPRKYLYIELGEQLLRWGYALDHFYSCDYLEVTLNELYDLIGKHPHGEPVVQPEETGCTHHVLMAQYAEDAAKTTSPWLLWEMKRESDLQWYRCSSHPRWDEHVRYRRASYQIGDTTPEGVVVAETGNNYVVKTKNGEEILVRKEEEPHG